MVTNHEGGNDSSSTAEQTSQWSELEQLGKAGFPGNQTNHIASGQGDQVPADQSKQQSSAESPATPEQVSAKLSELTTELHDLYQQDDNPPSLATQLAQPTSASPDRPAPESQPTPAPASFFTRFRDNLRRRQSDKSIQLIHKLSTSQNYKDSRKLEKLVSTGKFNFSDARVADAYLDTMQHAQLPDVERLTALGIPLEQIETNPHIQDLTIDSFRQGVTNVIEGNSYDIYTPRNLWQSPTGYVPSILARIAADDQQRARLAAGLDIQRYGDLMTDVTLDSIDMYTHDNQHDIESRQTATANIQLLKQLGFVPELDDSHISMLLKSNGRDPERCQAVAQEIGLIDSQVIDRMYAYKYHQLLAWAADDQSTTRPPELIIASQLTPGEDSPIANYWYQQSEALGQDAMLFGMRYAKYLYQSAHDDWERNSWTRDNNPEPQLADFINDGILQPAFFENESSIDSPMSIVKLSYHENRNEGSYNEAMMRFLALNLDQIHGENRGFIQTWANIHGTTDEETAAARLAFMKYATGNHNTELHFFNENGPTDNFYGHALNHLDIEEFMPYIDDNWQSHYNASELRYRDFHAQYPHFSFPHDADDADLDFRSTVNQYFTENGPSQQLAERMVRLQPSALVDYPEILAQLPESSYPTLAHNLLIVSRQQLANHPEITAYLPPHEQQYINFLSANHFPSSASGFDQETIAKYFDDSGAKPEFWTYEFGAGDYDTILSQDEDTIASLPFNDKQFATLDTYHKINDAFLRADFKQFVRESFDEIPISRIDVAPAVLTRLSESNASEMVAHRSAFAQQLLRIHLNDDAKMFESLSRIEDVFIHNNLPFVGKAFLSFQILHPADRLDSDFKLGSSNTISPVLQESSDDPLRGRASIIFADLLKASFGSNNRSIRDYLKSIKDGQQLFDSLSSGETSWDQFTTTDGEPLPEATKRDYDTLQIFAEHLGTLYNNTRAGQSNPYQMTGDLRQDLTTLTAAFAPNERHSLADRIVRSFGFFAGIQDFASAEALLTSQTAAADKRNQAAASSPLHLQSGDFVKGLGTQGIRYLPNILQNGSVAKEFLGDSAGSDATPLDTDLSLILTTPSSITEGISHTAAKGYGPIWLVLKGDQNRDGDPRLSITRRSPGESDQSTDAPNSRDGRLEAFYTGVLGADHYGIRTGFGSTEIDYFTVGDGSVDGTPLAQAIGLETAINGFYIPVANQSDGKIIFTPADYKALRDKMSGLSHYEAGAYQFSDDLSCPAVEIGGTRLASVAELVPQLAANEREVREKHAAIDAVIDSALADLGGLKRKNYMDGDLTEGFAELIDTGSTGRYDNAPGSGDFDYMMRLDKSITSNPELLKRVSDTLLAKFGKTEHAPGEVLANGNLRLKGVNIDGLATPVDIDITFIQKTNTVQYSTDMALADRLATIRAQSPEKHQQVVANIILAKQFLKAAGVYKPNRGETPQGGLGGVGVENWVLQNGGSFVAAAKEFMKTARECDNFSQFKSRYFVWDFGENHMGKGAKQHDNFVADNMSDEGYLKMKSALTSFLEQQGISLAQL